MDKVKIEEHGTYYEKLGFNLNGYIHVRKGTLRERWSLTKYGNDPFKKHRDLYGLSLEMLRAKWWQMIKNLLRQQICAKFVVENYLDGAGPYRESVDLWMERLVANERAHPCIMKKSRSSSWPWDGWKVWTADGEVSLWKDAGRQVRDLDVEKLSFDDIDSLLEFDLSTADEYIEFLRSLIESAERERLESRLPKAGEESSGHEKRL